MINITNKDELSNLILKAKSPKDAYSLAEKIIESADYKAYHEGRTQREKLRGDLRSLLGITNTETGVTLSRI